jgi:hypothetical protein
MAGFFDPTKQNGASPIVIPKMSDFSTALAKQLKQSAGISKIEVIKLGNPAATSNADLLYVASNPNYIYYTTEGEEGAGIGMISKEIIPTSLRFPNKTALIFRYGSYVACLPAAGVAEEILAEAAPVVAPSQTPVTTSQLDFAVLQPYVGTMFAIVKGAIYGDIGVADISTADMSDSPLDTDTNPINIPTNANKAIGVLVQLDPATATLSYKQSAEFPASLSLAQAYQSDLLPLRDEGKYRTGYIKLSAGVTSLNNGNVWPCPEFFPAFLGVEPIDAPDWGGFPDNSIRFTGQYTGDEEFYGFGGDEIRMHETWQVTGGDAGGVSSTEMNIYFEDATDRTFTLSAVKSGHSLKAKAEQASGGGGHKILLPMGCTWNGDGVNRALLMNTANDYVIAEAKSSTNNVVITSSAVSYAAS